MSIVGPRPRGVPDSAYKRQSKIPKKQRCLSCRGLGWVVFNHCMRYNEYEKCFRCDGSGKESVYKKKKRIMEDSLK